MGAGSADATFAFDVDPTGAQAGADAAADSIEGLQKSLDEGTAALSEMNKAMRLLKGGASTDVAAFRELRDAIAAKKTTLSQTTAALLSHGKATDVLRNKSKEADALAKKQAADQKQRDTVAKQTLDALKRGEAERVKATAKAAAQQKEAAAALKAHFAGLGEASQRLGGPLAKLSSQFSTLAELGGAGLIAAGSLAIAAAFLALAAAVVVATGALVGYGIAAANARRNELLQLEGLTKVRNWYGIAAGKATDLQAAIDGVSGSLSESRADVTAQATSLYQLGLRGENLRVALEGVETATAGAGKAQGDFYKGMIVSAARSGVSIKRVADDIKARFGEVAARKMLSLDVQSAKLRENFDALFRGVKIEGFLKALSSVTSLLSQSTVEGRELQRIVSVVLNPLIDAITSTGPLAKRFFQGMILAAQDVIIVTLMCALAFKHAFGKTTLGQIVSLNTALNIGKGIMYLLAGSIAAVAIAFGVVAVAATAALAVLFAPFIAGIGFVYLFIQGVKGIGAAFKSIDASGAGRDLVKGFIRGITLGLGDVVAAVMNLGAVAKAALKKALDSHSPSRAAAKIAFTFPQGGVVGIKKGLPAIRSAAEDMGKAATLGYSDGTVAPSPAPIARMIGRQAPLPSEVAAPRAAQQTAPSNVFHVVIHANTEEGGRAAAKGFEEQLGDALRGVAITFGAPKAVAP